MNKLTLEDLPPIRYITLTIVIVGVVVMMYGNVFSTLMAIWETKEEYGHGFLIPMIALYFIWEKRPLIRAEKLTASWSGIPIIIFAILLYFIGTVGDVGFLLRFSFIFSLLGLSLAILGYKISHIILIPILILIFSFPLPPVLQAGLTAKMQLISSQLGVVFIRFCDIPVYLEGNIIDLGHYKLQIIEACSGLNYLFPLMSLAFICAYLYQVVFWKRMLIFLTSIPITIFMNSFRIGVVGLLVEYWGTSMAEGFVHDFEGWVVFMGCLMVLVFEMWLLSWSERKANAWGHIFGMPPHTVKPYQKPYILDFLPITCTLLLMISAVIFIKPLAELDDIIPQRHSFKTFPLKLDALTGYKSSLDKKTLNFLGLSDYLLINYSDQKEDPSVNFYVAYYESQKQGNVPHSPKLCIPGGGWSMSQLTESHFEGIHFNRVIIKKGKSQKLVYYWYQQRGQTITSEYKLKWFTFIGAFNYQRTDGALVRLTTTIKENNAMADQRLQAFMKLIKHQLVHYIPH